MQMLSVILRHVHVTILETNTLANEWNFEAIVYVTMLSELNFCLYTKNWFPTRIGAILPTPVSPTPILPTYYCSVPFRLLKQNVTKTM